MQVHGELDGSVGHRLVVWQLEADPGSERSGEHAQAL